MSRADQLEILRGEPQGPALCSWPTPCCGKPEFDRAFRTFAERLFPEAKLEPIPPGRHAILARTSTVRRRSRQSACERSGRTVTGAEAEFHDSRPTQLEGIKVNGRWAVILQAATTIGLRFGETCLERLQGIRSRQCRAPRRRSGCCTR